MAGKSKSKDVADDSDLSAPRSIRLQEFGKRVRHFMNAKNMNQSQLAREAAEHMDDGSFSRDSVSKYVRGLNVPRPKHLKALSKALGVTTDELLPGGAMPYEGPTPPLDVREAGDGYAWLHVNQKVPWDIALQVLTLVKGKQ